MNDIYIIDYIGNSDDKGNPIGHPTKVINEYSGLLKDTYSINLIIPGNYKKVIKQDDIYSIKYLKHYMDMTATGLFKKLRNLYGRVSNLINVFKSSDESSILWFSNIDFVFFAVLSFYTPFKNKKIIATTFLQEFSDEGGKIKNKIKNLFFKKGISKVNCIISSNKYLNFSCKSIYIPDYFYNPEFYDKYKTNDKKMQVLCI